MSRVAPSAPVHVHVVDFDGPARFDPIGSTMLTTDALVQTSVHALGPFRGVKSLTLSVETAPLSEPPPDASVVRMAVPGTASWTDTGIDLIAGQRVTIDAADEVCFKGADVKWCGGPEGLGKPHPSNLPGFGRTGHGRLVAAIGDTRFAIGRDHSFVAAASGGLRIGINDRNTVNNRGAFAVRIVVAPAD